MARHRARSGAAVASRAAARGPDLPAPPFEWTSLLAVLVALALYLAMVHRQVLALPFINDDYFFLDQTRTAGFFDLWSAGRVQFGWYRPLSREVHYWTLQRLFGVQEAPFHVMSFGLWVVVMALYWSLLRRLAGARVATVASAAVAVLALWAAPVFWVAGVQDLWMLALGLSCLLAFAHRRSALASIALAGALLSKETAGVFPPIAFALAWIADRDRPVRALRRTAPLFAILAVWFVLHPTILPRLTGRYVDELEIRDRPSAAITALRTLGSLASLDQLPAPESGWPAALTSRLVVPILFGGLVAWSLRRRKGGGPEMPPPSADRGHTLAFAAVWAAIGFLPLFLPSINWHAYYGVVGVLGIWFAFALGLVRRPRVAVAAVVVLALLQSPRADTPSWEWSSESFQRRAGRFIQALRADLLRRHPDVLPHSRFYFAYVPEHIGLISGDGPVLRVWYADSTVRGDFLSSYTVRPSGAPAGLDYFLRVDSTLTWVELTVGPEDVAAARAANPYWLRDHELLAATFYRAGDLPRAAVECAKLSEVLPDDARPAFRAAGCWIQMGDTLAAMPFLARAASAPNAEPRMRELHARLAPRFGRPAGARFPS